MRSGRRVDEAPALESRGRCSNHGVVELLGADELDVGRDAVGGAEVERLLGLRARRMRRGAGGAGGAGGV